ncbi:hypothetical protein [Thermotalea metallivorans]|uniref:Uncharacterized protein n=1 Tax=Thermotalea metallivorans TaxID=520762 RepID=A0A140L964_9FIRM|nr:hypothetical protein [Thermotalea metallivorans]KXG77089.1 hypothetical protein AN619_06170 [Thermotalea metallivorans]
MDERIYLSHCDTIKNFVKNLGIDSTDDYLQQELSSLMKDVVFLREKIDGMRKLMEKSTNYDEMLHLQYDIDDAQCLLDNLLQKLKTADERYICFKQYIAKIKSGLV